MPNVLNISGYKKVGLFSAPRKGIVTQPIFGNKERKTRGPGGPNGLNAGVRSAFSSGKVVFQAFVFHPSAWALRRGGMDLFSRTLIHTAIRVVLITALGSTFCSRLQRRWEVISGKTKASPVLFSPPRLV